MSLRNAAQSEGRALSTGLSVSATFFPPAPGSAPAPALPAEGDAVDTAAASGAALRLRRLDALAVHRRILMLQGPNGPFFYRLARRLQASGADVTKVHFHAGDALFWPRRGAIHYRATSEQWPRFLEELVAARRIEAILLFGQFRPQHIAAIRLARRHGIAIHVFEEGYIRPWWITLERDGVNAHSPLTAIDPNDLPQVPETAPPVQFRFAYTKMAAYSFLYFLAGRVFRSAYPHYVHHHPFRYRMVLPWLRSGLRKLLYRLTERRTQQWLLGPASGAYFLVPLQLQSDSQLRFHSGLSCNTEFIATVITSFAAHAPADAHLVFKHHPMERGHTHYGAAIGEIAAAHGISDRVRYIHDGHLPSLLANARGVVVVNSTTGLQAMHHGTPVHLCGRAFYARPELVSLGPLDGFWTRPIAAPRELTRRFLDVVLDRSQVNASFYVDGGLSDLPSRVPHGDPTASALSGMPRVPDA